MANNNQRQGFDRSKDRVIWEHEVNIGAGKSLKIGKYSYDGKEEKIGVVRVTQGSTSGSSGAPEIYHNPLGRFTLEEFGIISQVINEKEQM